MSAPVTTLCPLCVTMVNDPDIDYSYEALHTAHSVYVSRAVEALRASGQPVDPDHIVRTMVDYFLRRAIAEDVEAYRASLRQRANARDGLN